MNRGRRAPAWAAQAGATASWAASACRSCTPPRGAIGCGRRRPRGDSGVQRACPPTPAAATFPRGAHAGGCGYIGRMTRRVAVVVALDAGVGRGARESDGARTISPGGVQRERPGVAGDERGSSPAGSPEVGAERASSPAGTREGADELARSSSWRLAMKTALGGASAGVGEVGSGRATPVRGARGLRSELGTSFALTLVRPGERRSSSAAAPGRRPHHASRPSRPPPPSTETPRPARARCSTGRAARRASRRASPAW